MTTDPLDGLTPEMEEWIAANPPPPLSAEQAQLAATMFRAGLDAEQAAPVAAPLSAVPA